MRAGTEQRRFAPILQLEVMLPGPPAARDDATPVRSADKERDNAFTGKIPKVAKGVKS